MKVMRLLILFLLVVNIQFSQANEIKPLRILVFGGGTHHQFKENVKIFADQVYNSTLDSKYFYYTEDTDDLKYNNLTKYDVLVLYCCSYYPSPQYENKPTPDHVKTNIPRFVREGGGLVCVHSAIATFADWKEFINLIGGLWVWDKSAHDKYQTIKSHVIAEHPIVDGLPEYFEFDDEFYHTLRILPSSKILIESTHEKNGKRVTEPLAWIAKDNQRERVVVLLHGHDKVSWSHPHFQKLLKQSIEWSARKR